MEPLQQQIAGIDPVTDDIPLDQSKVAHATPVLQDDRADTASFLSLRITYLIVTLVVMLADGLQGAWLLS